MFNYGDKPPILEWASSLYKHEYTLNGKKVLEIGSGTGEFWRYILSDDNFRDGDITLTDISSGMLKDCENNIRKSHVSLENNIKIKYALTDLDELESYPSNSFDVVIAHFVIYHAQNPRKALKEIHRIIKPGGFLGLGIVDEKSSEGLWKAGHQVDSRIPELGFTAVFCETHLEKESLLKEFSSCHTNYYKNRLRFNKELIDVPIKSLKSSPTISGLDLHDNDFEQLREVLNNQIERTGAFEYDYLARLYLCHKRDS